MNASIGEPDFAENLARWVEPGCQDGFPYPVPSPRTELYSLKMGGKPSQLEDCLSGLGSGKLNVVPGFELLPKIMHGRKQLWRIGYVAIYNEEVIFIQHRGEHLLPRGRLMPPHEIYPSSEQWGENGFSYTPNSQSEPLAAAFAKTIGLTFTRS